MCVHSAFRKGVCEEVLPTGVELGGSVPAHLADERIDEGLLEERTDTGLSRLELASHRVPRKRAVWTAPPIARASRRSR